MLATAVLAGVVGACIDFDGPVAAHHDVVLVGDRIAIDTTFSRIVDGERRLLLAVPLPEHASITGARAETGAAGVTALVLDAPYDMHPSVRVELDAAQVESSGRLPLPIACGTFLQRVRMGEELAFRPDPRLGLVVHMGRTQPATMSKDEREAFDAHLPAMRSEIGALYISTEEIIEQGGVIGRLERRAESKQRVAIGMGVVFVVLCGAGAAIYLRTRRDAEAEHADAVLAAEIDALDGELR